MRKKKISDINFVLQTQNIKDFRYESIDDWFDPFEYDDMLQFKVMVADMANPDYNFLVLIHALVEQYLCYKKGITDKKVTEFDIQHTHCLNPGEHTEAPYHLEHTVANDVEAKVANALNVDWPEYEKMIDKTIAKWRKKHA